MLEFKAFSVFFFAEIKEFCEISKFSLLSDSSKKFHNLGQSTSSSQPANRQRLFFSIAVFC